MPVGDRDAWKVVVCRCDCLTFAGALLNGPASSSCLALLVRESLVFAASGPDAAAFLETALECLLF